MFQTGLIGLVGSLGAVSKNCPLAPARLLSHLVGRYFLKVARV